VLSLAIIRLLHAQIGPRRRSGEPIAASKAIAQESAVSAPARAELRSKSPSLEVEAEKELQAFTLRVKLTAGKGAVGLLGASGAGKSMTLRLIAGIVSPTRGRITLNSRVLFDSSTGQHVPAAERRIGVVFQDYALFPHMTVAENVGFGLGALTKHERTERVQGQLQRMHIAELAQRFPREISGGQRQRVALARCMAIEPDALLLDEPFAALDPHLRRQMEEQLRETLADYHGAVLFVTHDMEEAFRFCSDLLVLEDGKVIASGPKHALFERPRSVTAARLTGCKNIVAARRIDARRIAVDDWDCELQTAEALSDGLTHVGMRSHQIAFVEAGSLAPSAENSFPCWLVATSEAPHEMTLYLHLHNAPEADARSHLQADVPKELWRSLSAQPQPWYLSLRPSRLLLLEG